MKKWGWVIFVVVFSVIVWRTWALYDNIETPQEKQQNQAVSAAKEQYDIKHVLNVTYYHGSQAYHVVKAANQNGKTVFAWIPGGKGKSFIKSADEGWSKSKVKQYVQQKLHPKKLIDVRLGVEDSIPLWEVVYIDQKGLYTFYYLRFEDGVWYKNIHL